MLDDWFKPDNTYDAALRLLGRQLIEPEGRFVGKVDDLELTFRPDGSATVTAILTGPGAWADAMPGFMGRYIRAVWRRLHPDVEPSPTRIPLSAVDNIDSAVHITLPRHTVIAGGTEEWVRDHIINKIPGAGDEED